MTDAETAARIIASAYRAAREGRRAERGVAW
jgi:hypothetical protein